MTEEIRTLVTTLRHVRLVARNLRRITSALEERAALHDSSKLSEDEFGGFVQIGRVAREHEYGSPEYVRSIEGVDAVRLHYSRNRHHPEHHDDGVWDMSFVDFVEMIADWKAVNVVRGEPTWEEAVEIHKERFGLTEVQVGLVRFIAEAME